MVKALYVARHGLRANHDPSPTGVESDPRLTDEGAQQAQELGAFVSDAAKLSGDKITAIYSSPFYRCLQTATPASKLLSVPIWVEPGIGEHYTRGRPTKPIPWTAKQSTKFFDTIDLSYSSDLVPNPIGETRQDLDNRVQRAIDQITAHADANGHDTVLIVTHAAVKIAICEVLTGETVRAGTCSLDKYVPVPQSENSKHKWRCIMHGNTEFLSGGEQMHWSFDMAYEAGSAADEASRRQADTRLGDVTENNSSDTETVKSLISLDMSALSAEQRPADADLPQMTFAKLETDRPIVQIGDKIYEGQWQRTVGTDVMTSNAGEPLGASKYRIKLTPASIEIPQRDRRNLVEKIEELKQQKQKQQQQESEQPKLSNVNV